MLWGSRKFMSFNDFSSLIFKHPDIPIEICEYLYRKFCRGASKLIFDDFVFAIAVLTRAPQSIREGYFFCII